MLKRSYLMFQRRYASSFLKQFEPAQKFFEDPSIIFSPGAIIRNYDVIPILGFTLVSFFCECVTIVRLSLTRDDVRFSPTGRMACEVVDFEKPRKLRRPPIRKMLVFNQKYEWPPGLLDAIRAPSKAELDEMEKKNKKKK